MLQKFFKYHGAGNDFLLADNRDGRLSLNPSQISHLCDRHTGFGADGVMLLERSDSQDFRMVFYNPDGSGGMMCGNGGRCIVAFAADRGVVSGQFPVVFEAPDGLHTAVILNSERGLHTICLKMKDVYGIEAVEGEDACFLDTGTRHVVKPVTGLKEYPVVEEGRRLRNDPRFAPEGTNVNFVEYESVPSGTLLHIRTFEKGVEDETLACGTGIVASALAACHGKLPAEVSSDGRVSYGIRSAIATLSVDFLPESEDPFRVSDIWLTGPAEFVGTMECFL